MRHSPSGPCRAKLASRPVLTINGSRSDRGRPLKTGVALGSGPEPSYSAGDVHSSYCLTAEMRPNPCKDVIYLPDFNAAPIVCK